MCFAWWITMATDTHSEYVIPRQQILHERAPKLRHTNTACLVQRTNCQRLFIQKHIHWSTTLVKHCIKYIWCCRRSTNQTIDLTISNYLHDLRTCVCYTEPTTVHTHAYRQHTCPSLPGNKYGISDINQHRGFLGFPVSISKCWDGSQHSKLPLHASHVALPT